MELYKGRPENIQGRLDKEIRVYDLLDSLGIEYERTDHEQTDTMEADDQNYQSFLARIFSCATGKRQTSICL